MRSKHLATALSIALLLTSAPVSSQNDPRLKPAEDYARQDHGCALDHGYVCRDQHETDNFESIESNNAMIPASYLQAWQVAAADFAKLEDIEPERRELKHYKFGFTEDDQHYIIHFQALLLPEIKAGKPEGIIRATFGLTTRYWIDKSSMAVTKRLFYKT